MKTITFGPEQTLTFLGLEPQRFGLGTCLGLYFGLDSGLGFKDSLVTLTSLPPL